jgi:hypothetical protein
MVAPETGENLPHRKGFIINTEIIHEIELGAENDILIHPDVSTQGREPVIPPEPEFRSVSGGEGKNRTQTEHAEHLFHTASFPDFKSMIVIIALPLLF